MAEIRVRPVSAFYRSDFLARVFHEMCQHKKDNDRFPIGKSLSWQGFQIAASKADLATVCVQALDFREPNIRPDRQRFAAFRLSLGTRMLDMELPFTTKQLRVMGESLIMALKTNVEAFPVERVGALLQERTDAL